MTPAKMRIIAQRLFIAGFFGLPFLWLVNAAFFRRYYKHPSTPAVVNTCKKFINIMHIVLKKKR